MSRSDSDKPLAACRDRGEVEASAIGWAEAGSWVAFFLRFVSRFDFVSIKKWQRRCDLQRLASKALEVCKYYASSGQVFAAQFVLDRWAIQRGPDAMSLWHKAIGEITFADVEASCQQRRRQGPRLDYKREWSKGWNHTCVFESL